LVDGLHGRHALIKREADVQVGYVGLRQVSRKREVDRELPLRARFGRYATISEGLKALDGVGQKLYVEVEADRADVAALVSAEQIASASDFQIALGDLKTSPEFSCLEYSL
jgi:hypothetical protein